MFDAVGRALSQLFTPALRAVLMKAVGLSLALIILIGLLLHRLLFALAQAGADWAEQASGYANHAAWSALAWVLSIMAGLGIVTGALFLMPAVSALVGSFFVDEVADHIERVDYPADPPGTALPFASAILQGAITALLALAIYMFALPFMLFGIGIFVLFFANAWLLSREYFELAAMRFRPVAEAKLLRKQHAGYLFGAGMIIALFVSIPILNFATPVFAMAFMVHLHKKLTGSRAELIVPQSQDAAR